MLTSSGERRQVSITSDASGSSNHLYDGLSKAERRALKKEAARQGVAMYGLNGIPEDRISLPRSLSLHSKATTTTTTTNTKRFEYKGYDNHGKTVDNKDRSGKSTFVQGHGQSMMNFSDLWSDEEEYQRYKAGPNAAVNKKSYKRSKSSAGASTHKRSQSSAAASTKVVKGDTKVSSENDSGEPKAKKKGVMHSMSKTIGKVGKNTGNATVKGAKTIAKGGGTVVKKTKAGATTTAKVTKKGAVSTAKLTKQGAVSAGTQAKKSAQCVKNKLS